MQVLPSAASIDHPTRSFAMTPLRQHMLEDMSIRNRAQNTQQMARKQGQLVAPFGLANLVIAKWPRLCMQWAPWRSLAAVSRNRLSEIAFMSHAKDLSSRCSVRLQMIRIMSFRSALLHLLKV
jgi:hypothetical protein